MKIEFENGSTIEGVEGCKNIRGLRSNIIHILTDEEQEQIMSIENPMKIILDKMFSMSGVPEEYLNNRKSVEIDIDVK